MEAKMKHLEMIQNVITRMASNSFLLKGWTVTLVVGLLAYGNIKEMNVNFMFIALIPALILWILDAFYLNEERKYIKLYEHVAKIKNEKIDFLLNAHQYEKETGGIVKAIFSKTLGVFYFPTLFVVIAVIFAYQ